MERVKHGLPDGLHKAVSAKGDSLRIREFQGEGKVERNPSSFGGLSMKFILYLSIANKLLMDDGRPMDCRERLLGR